MLKPFKAVFLQNQNGNGLNTAPGPSFCLNNYIGLTMTHFMTRSIDFIRGNLSEFYSKYIMFKVARNGQIV